MIGAARGAIAFGLMLAVPAQVVAACCLVPRIDHIPAHAAPASHAHASTPQSGYDPGAHSDRHRAGDGLTPDRGGDRAPCIVPSAPLALREKAGASSCDGAAQAPIASMRPDISSTPPVEIVSRHPVSAGGSFRPLRL